MPVASCPFAEKNLTPPVFNHPLRAVVRSPLSCLQVRDTQLPQPLHRHHMLQSPLQPFQFISIFFVAWGLWSQKCWKEDHKHFLDLMAMASLTQPKMQIAIFTHVWLTSHQIKDSPGPLSPVILLPFNKFIIRSDHLRFVHKYTWYPSPSVVYVTVTLNTWPKATAVQKGRQILSPWSKKHRMLHFE